MSSKKQEMSPADFDKPYEGNEIGVKGILGFAAFLLILIVITFGLMWAFLNVLRDYSKENAGAVNPMQMTDMEKLPPEPRLQAAPGFGVDSKDGRVNIELMAPQSEYREMRKQWEEQWKHGQKDAKTGMITMLPVEEAKAKFLEQKVKAKSGADAEAFFKASHKFVSDASSGRVASETAR